eukprot:11981521-Alexandrium_andersonii.AAC.1
MDMNLGQPEPAGDPRTRPAQHRQAPSAGRARRGHPRLSSDHRRFRWTRTSRRSARRWLGKCSDS